MEAKKLKARGKKVKIRAKIIYSQRRSKRKKSGVR